MLVEDDLQFQQEELWIEQCQEAFLQLKIEAQDYMKNQAIPKTAETGSTSKPAEIPTEDEIHDTEEPVAEENDTSTQNEENQDLDEMPTPLLIQENQDDNVQPIAPTSGSLDSTGNTGGTETHVNNSQKSFSN